MPSLSLASDASFFNADGIQFDINVLDSFRKKIYNGFDTANEVEPGMWKEIVRIMNEAAVEGISQSRAGYNPKDEDFYNALRHSNEVFSTFKVHTFGVEMASKLFDSNGNLRSFDEWTKATMGIASHQVGSWLETEYNTAIIRAHQAADWQEFVRNKDIFPNLRWMMTTSPEPEDTHKHYWMTGLTLPIDDPFWNKHYPGDRWNCKCSLEATADPVVRPADIKEEKPQRGLDTNAGKTGELFSSTHPYFPKDCSHCFAKKNAPFTIQNAFQRFFNANYKGNCNKCNYCKRTIPLEKESSQKAIYHKLKNDPNYVDVQYDKRSGGIKAIHKGHIIHSSEKDERFFGGLTTTDLELSCQNELVRMGHTAILCDESKKKNGNNLTALDLKLDGNMMDIRSITGTGWYSNPMVSKNKQIVKYNKREDITEEGHALCLYFHDPSLYDSKKMKKSIKYFKHYRMKDGQLINRQINKIVCVVKGYDDVIEYDI